jgi:S-adenosylmethionine synthetase
MSASELAGRLHREGPGVREATVWLHSSIDRRIDQPTLALAQVILEKTMALDRVEPSIRKVMEEAFAGMVAFCHDLARSLTGGVKPSGYD